MLQNPDRTLTLVETARSRAPGWRGIAIHPGFVYLRLQKSSLPDWTTIALTRATDERGRDVLRPVSGKFVPEEARTSHLFTREMPRQHYRVRILPGARRLNLTFAIYKPRTVTFLAKPGT
jgi:hypothetical protein